MHIRSDPTNKYVHIRGLVSKLRAHEAKPIKQVPGFRSENDHSSATDECLNTVHPKVEPDLLNMAESIKSEPSQDLPESRSNCDDGSNPQIVDSRHITDEDYDSITNDAKNSELTEVTEPQVQTENKCAEPVAHCSTECHDSSETNSQLASTRHKILLTV